MTRLVALDLPGGPAFVDAVARCWDAGDAVLVLDRRLPAPTRQALAERAGAGEVLDEHGLRTTGAAPAPLIEGDALVAASSGSTGVPKLVVHTASGLAAHAGAVHRRLAVDPTRDRWLACLPLNHLGGFGVVARALLTDTPLDVIDGFDATTVAAAPDRLGATLVSLVPTALDRIDPGTFRMVVLGGAADGVERPANVVRTYGLTETGGGVVYDGRPLPGVEVRVGPEGAIAVRSPSTARGLLTPSGVIPLVDADGWLATGDLGRWDGDQLVVSGRSDELIVTGGENVWPAPVEDLLRRIPGVADAAVTGVADPVWGARVVALVVPADPADPPGLEELRATVRSALGAPYAPKELVLVPTLPRTALGKLARSALGSLVEADRP